MVTQLQRASLPEAHKPRSCTFNESLRPLLPLLRCPVCPSRDVLEIQDGSATTNIQIQLHDKHLLCRRCHTEYPITEDFIPIMWDLDVEDVFTHVHASHTESLAALSANMAVYDAISDDYNLHSRRSAHAGRRMQTAAKRIFPTTERPEVSLVASEKPARYHLDFGCGPGHVIGWLKDFGYRQIGLDISLNNLRNARKHTGCFVVCGSACNMPFADEAIDLVTEGSVLHHIRDWKKAVTESLRVCKREGGIVLDAEPSRAQLAWSPLAVWVLESRFRVYQILSYFFRDKYMFRNVKQARLNLQAEIHHQPGMGFPPDAIKALFEGAGFDVEIVLTASTGLTSESHATLKSIIGDLLRGSNPWNPEHGSFARPDWKQMILDVLSAKKPWKPEYGMITAIGSPRGSRLRNLHSVRV